MHEHRTPPVILTPEQLAAEDEARDLLAQPTPWLADAVYPPTPTLAPTSEPIEQTVEQLQVGERVQEYLQRPAPWLPEI